MRRVDTSGGPNACWPWTGALDANGYGRCGIKPYYTHRVSYLLTTGAIPDGLDLDHTCHDGITCTAGNGCQHRRCANPAHLKPVTRFENCRRGRQAQQTHCINGHPFDSDNLVMRFRRSGAPYRQCRACSHIRSQHPSTTKKAGAATPATTNA